MSLEYLGSIYAVSVTPPSLAIEEPLHPPLRSRCHPLPLPSRSHRVPCCQGAVAPSLAVKELLRHPLPSPSRSHCAVPRRRGAIAPSINGAIVPSLAVKEPSRRPLPSPSRSHRAVHCRRGVVAPSIAVTIKEPSHRPLPSRSHCTIHCC